MWALPKVIMLMGTPVHAADRWLTRYKAKPGCSPPGGSPTRRLLIIADWSRESSAALALLAISRRTRGLIHKLFHIITLWQLSDEVLVKSVWSEVQIVCIWSSWWHCHPKTPSSLASFKSRLVLPFWHRLSQVVLEKRPLNGFDSSSITLWQYQKLEKQSPSLD